MYSQVSYHISVETLKHLLLLSPNVVALDLDGLVVPAQELAELIHILPCLKTLCAPYLILNNIPVNDLVLTFKDLNTLVVQESDIKQEEATLLISRIKSVNVVWN